MWFWLKMSKISAASKNALLPFLALFLIRGSSISFPLQGDLIKEADLLLDMMEYQGAVDNYQKALSHEPGIRDIRRRIAFAHFELGQSEDALKFLKEELTLFPDNTDAYDLLVGILFKLNNLNKANIFLEKNGFPAKFTLENQSLGGYGYFVLGMNFKENKNYDKANIFFRKALEKGYNPVACYVQLIDIGLIQGKLDSDNSFRLAGYILNEAISSYGFWPEFHYMAGLLYLERYKTNANYFQPALNNFHGALKIKPDFMDACLNIGCLSYNRHDFKSASEYFEKALIIDPENAKVKFYLDCARKKLNESGERSTECPEQLEFSRELIDNPEREYRHKLKNDRLFVLQNINSLGLEFIENGNFYGAIRRFHNALKIYPECPEVNYNLGMVYSWLGYLAQAEKYALMALRERGIYGELPAYRRKKILEIEGEQMKKAFEIPLSKWTFDEALKAGNYFLEAYHFLGNIYFKKEDFERSIRAYKKVLEINPEDAMGHYSLGCAYWAQNGKQQAEEEWKKAIKYEEKQIRVGPEEKISGDDLKVSLVVYKRTVSFQAHKSLGRLYVERNLLDQALYEFEKAIELEPGEQESYYNLGKICLTKKDKEKAIYYFEKYLYFGGKEEAEVKEILRSLKGKK